MTPTLFDLANQLRHNEVDLAAYVAALSDYFTEREPSVLAFVPETGRFDRLYRDAQQLQQQYPQPDQRPPLFGVPIGVKDIFHVHGFLTRAGTEAVPAALLQGLESPVVTRLKSAGALILGKTVTTEFAYFAPGPTRNPHNPAHTPGGSSSGSAAAVGAGLSPLTLGTQTIGSIIRPAAFCGVVGYKPSYERLSREGVIPLAPSLDHVGYFTPDVAGMTLVASLTVANWRSTTPQRPPVLAIPVGVYLDQADDEALARLFLVADQLRQAGLTVKEVDGLPDFTARRQTNQQLLAYEVAQVHAHWFDAYGADYHPQTIALIQQGQMVTAAMAAAARQQQLHTRQSLLTMMAEQGIDLWLSPAAPGAAPVGLDNTGDPVMNLPWSFTGFPVVGLPAGVNGAGLPLGVQITGRFGHDEQLLAWAAAVAPLLMSGTP